MKIGIDADGVLTDMSGFYSEYGEKFFKRKPSNLTGYSISEMFKCTPKQELEFGLRYFIKYCKDCPPREHCPEVIASLNHAGHDLYEITARKFVTKKNLIGWYSRKLFENWLARYQMEFKDIFYCSESSAPTDKLNGCKRFSIDIMIDDRPNVALHLAENGIKVLLFDAKYNQNVAHKNIIRVADWEDVNKKVSELNK